MDTVKRPARGTNGPRLEFDAVVIGAGVAGLYQLYKLRELGLRVRAFETGSAVGGPVLEPLSGRALRLGKLDVWLFVLEGAARRMGVGRALFGRVPHRALSQPCRRQVRPAARHPIQ